MSAQKPETLIDDRPAEGVFRVHREAFRNPDLFARELAAFFEGGWVFVGHTSQLPNLAHLETLPAAGHVALWGHPTYYRALSRVNGGRAVETDLFAGLR